MSKTDTTSASASADASSNEDAAGTEEHPQADEVTTSEAEAAAGAEAPAEDGSAEVIDAEALGERIAELEAALEESRDQLLRGQAELENLRRRAQRDVENAHKFGLERFVSEMLPVLDSMELALQAAGQESATVDSIKEGTELTLKMLVSALEKFDVAAIAPENEPFDPELHQAMSMQSIEGVESGTVVQVFQKGYSLSGRLVRPAMVVVSQ